jgi:hypothetical protein
LKNGRINVRSKNFNDIGRDRGDQIGQIFVQLATAYFVQFFKKPIIDPNFRGNLFPQHKLGINVDKKWVGLQFLRFSLKRIWSPWQGPTQNIFITDHCTFVEASLRRERGFHIQFHSKLSVSTKRQVQYCALAERHFVNWTIFHATDLPR